MTIPTTNVSFSSIQTEFGGSAPIALSEYYQGGTYVPTGVMQSPVDGSPIPTSGTIRVGEFRGVADISFPADGGSILNGDGTTGGPSNAIVRFVNDGTIAHSSTPNNSGYSGPTNWLSPTTAGVGAGYELQVVSVSGTPFSHPTVGSWVSLSSTQTFTLSKSGYGTANSTCSIQIRDASSLAIVTSCSLELDLDNS